MCWAVNITIADLYSHRQFGRIFLTQTNFGGKCRGVGGQTVPGGQSQPQYQHCKTHTIYQKSQVVFHLSPQDGSYTLKAFDENYEPYLNSVGVPGFVVPIILRASETITVKATAEGANLVTQTGEAFRPEGQS